ncbi:hypothetical protein COOONC_22107 [Cooperia oncophora]
MTIPKMKIDTDFKLKEALIAMGVDEEETTAAAATYFGVVPMSMIVAEPVKFRADHPFLFILTKDNNPLFMGQFA